MYAASAGRCGDYTASRLAPATTINSVQINNTLIIRWYQGQRFHRFYLFLFVLSHIYNVFGRPGVTFAIITTSARKRERFEIFFLLRKSSKILRII